MEQGLRRDEAEQRVPRKQAGEAQGKVLEPGIPGGGAGRRGRGGAEQAAGSEAGLAEPEHLQQPLPLKCLLGPLLGLSSLTPSLDPQTCPFPLKIATGESVPIV